MCKELSEYKPGDEDSFIISRGYLRRYALAKAVFIARVHWHYLAGKSGKPYAKVKRKDKYFIVKTRQKWADECCMSLDQIDAAIEFFRNQGLIETENHLVPGGLRVLHLRYLMVEGDGVINPKTFFQEFTEKSCQLFSEYNLPELSEF